ncbi:MAG: hypothetical protein V3W18_03785 [candidate division Zixibacteria bacterium]
MKIIIYGIIALICLSCSSPVKKELSESAGELTERELWRFHRDIRYTYFYYEDGEKKEGLLLRWKPDSILVQPRGVDLPWNIPAAGIKAIRLEMGNRVWSAFTIGTIAALVYIGVIKSYDLTDVSTGDAFAKLAGPPAILAGAMAIGSGKYTYDDYRLPDGFVFDFDKVNSLYEALE